MKDFVPYSEALVLIILGFDEECFGLFVKDKSLLIKQMPNQQECEQYFGGILAPTFSQAFGFFRDNFNLEPQVKSWKEKGGIVWHYSIQKIGEPSIFRSSDCAVDSHDEAQLICLQKLIELCKK